MKFVILFLINSAAIATFANALPNINNLELQVNTNTNRVVCYYGRSLNESRPPRLLNASDINTNLCTHVIWSSVILERYGDLSTFKINITNASSIVQEFNNKKSKDVKSLLSWGGWNENLPMYQRTIQSTESRASLIRKLLKILLDYKFDGLDVDLSFNNVVDVDLNSQIFLLRELKNQLYNNNLILSVAISGNVRIIKRCYCVKDLSAYADLINIKGYDLLIPNKSCRLLAPLRKKEKTRTVNLEDSVKALLLLGAPASKLILGVPMVAHRYVLVNPEQNSPGSAVINKKLTISYAEACQLLNRRQWTQRYDEIAEVDWAYESRNWISFPSARSTKAKAKFAQQLRLGGVAAWGIGWDDHASLCNSSWPLLSALNNVLRPSIFYVNGLSPRLISDSDSVNVPTLIDSPSLKFGSILNHSQIVLTEEEKLKVMNLITITPKPLTSILIKHTVRPKQYNITDILLPPIDLNQPSCNFPLDDDDDDDESFSIENGSLFSPSKLDILLEKDTSSHVHSINSNINISIDKQILFEPLLINLLESKNNSLSNINVSINKQITLQPLLEHGQAQNITLNQVVSHNEKIMSVNKQVKDNSSLTLDEIAENMAVNASVTSAEKTQIASITSSVAKATSVPEMSSSKRPLPKQSHLLPQQKWISNNKQFNNKQNRQTTKHQQWQHKNRQMSTQNLAAFSQPLSRVPTVSRIIYCNKEGFYKKFVDKTIYSRCMLTNGYLIMRFFKCLNGSVFNFKLKKCAWTRK